MIEASTNTEVRPPQQGLFPGAIVRSPDEAQPASGFIQTTGEKVDWGGNTTRRSLETDPNTTVCIPDIPTVGKQLVTQWTTHAFFWTDGHGQAVLLPTDDITRIRPLSGEPLVLYDLIPGGIQPVDVFERPDDTRLIHIGVDTHAALAQEIKDRAKVAEVINIQVGTGTSTDDWRWPQFVATYDGFNLGIFPISGDDYQSFPVGNAAPESDASPLYVRFGKYIQNGGVIPWQIMKVVNTLSIKEIQKEYSRRYCLEGPKYFAQQLLQIARDSEMVFTPEQIIMYVKLRLISVPAQLTQPTTTYKYGPQCPQRKLNGTDVNWVDPTSLGEIGLAGQVLKFTQDIDGENKLGEYAQLCNLRRSPLV